MFFLLQPQKMQCQQLTDDFASIFALGYGGLALSIEGPSKVDINCEDVEDGTCRVTYCPTEPGNYNVNIKFAEKHIPGQNLYTFLIQKHQI